jgi:FkbM family methyltransferase
MRMKLREIKDTKSQLGFNFRVKVEENSPFYNEYASTGVYEKGTCHIMKGCLKSGDVFVDIGAHFGFMTTFASHLVGESGFVYAYEPNPDTFEILEYNQEFNCLKNVTTECCAISSQIGSELLYDISQNGVAGSMSLMQPIHNCNTQKVICHTPSSCSMKHILAGDKDLSMIKIDVEGFEDKVLDGLAPFLNNLRQKYYPTIICEVSGGKEWRDYLYNKLTKLHNYMMFKLERNKGWSGKLVTATKSNLNQHDNIFCFDAECLNKAPINLF